MLLSIIIPIYNAEKALNRSARSLMNQTLDDNIEFIFINDSSQDKSLAILQKIVSEYPNRARQVHIISNEQNFGPHVSRLRGINDALGEYIGFCDADDWVEPTMFERMLAATFNGQKDIVVCNYIRERLSGSETFLLEPFAHPHDALANMHRWHQFSWAMWNQLVRKSIIQEEIQHICPTKFREDTYLMMRCYYRARSIEYIPTAFYHYNLSDSASLIHSRKLNFAGWQEQKENMDRICELLYETKAGYRKFHFGVNNFKFMIKNEFADVFPTTKGYYYAFRECHWDAIKYYCHQSHSAIIGLKMWLVYCTNYIIFEIYARKAH